MNANNTVAKKWAIPEENKDFQQKVSSEHGISKVAAQILFNRSITADDEIFSFLNPKFKDTHDPFLLNDMQRAVMRTYEAFLKNEKIIVYGDYDVDGITSVSLLFYLFSAYDKQFTYYIPHRVKEGYGLSIEGIKWCHTEKATLIITVDCGSSSKEEIAFAKSLGIDVIVLDHHEVKNEPLDCIALINPKRKDSTYPFPNLAGVGVTFKFAHAVINFFKEEEYPAVSDFEITDLLDLVSLGTLADIMPLIDENRIFVKYGLKMLSESTKAGLNALINKIGKSNQEITEHDVCFKLAPRINAIGRLGDSALAVKLMTTAEESSAHFLAETFENHNIERQKIEQEILAEALAQAKTNTDPVLVLSGDNWHVGVIGIVASRLMHAFSKPTIIIAIDEDMGKGSGRSFKNFPLFEGLKHCQHLLKEFGGHNLAAGITIKQENIEKFKKEINLFANEHLSEDEAFSEITIDTEVELKDITENFMEELDRLSPFGEGNPRPVFLAKNVTVDKKFTLSNGKHLRLNLSQGNTTAVEAIGFGLGYLSDKITKNHPPISIVFYPQITTYNNRSFLQLIIQDLQVG